MALTPRRDSNQQSQQASGRRPRSHRDRLLYFLSYHKSLSTTYRIVCGLNCVVVGKSHTLVIWQVYKKNNVTVSIKYRCECMDSEKNKFNNPCSAHIQWRGWVFWNPLRVITIAAPNRNYELKITLFNFTR